jgi:hypothetical protein
VDTHPQKSGFSTALYGISFVTSLGLGWMLFTSPWVSDKSVFVALYHNAFYGPVLAVENWHFLMICAVPIIRHCCASRKGGFYSWDWFLLSRRMDELGSGTGMM